MADQTMQELHALLLGEGRSDPAQLRDLAPVLPEPFLLPAIELANLIENRQLRAQVLVALAARLPEGKRELVLRKALAAWEPEVHRVNDSMRVWAMGNLQPHLPDVLLGELLAITQGIEDANSRARALVAIAPRLPEALLGKALATALAMPELVYQEDPLSAMVPHLSDTLVQEALGATLQIGEEGRRARALVKLAPRLSHPLLVADAFTAARAIENESDWAPVIVALARHLPERLRREAVAAVQEIQASQLRTRALVCLSPYLAEPLREEVQREVLAGVREMDSPDQKAELLSLLVPFASPPLQHEILAEVLASARSIGDRYLQAQALAIVAEYLPEPMKEEVQKEALAAAQEIEDEGWRAYALGHLTSYPTEWLQAEALAAASAIEEERWRARALAEMAQHLSRPLQLTALDQARQIGDPVHRMTALMALEPHIPDALRAEEVEGVRFAQSLVMSATAGQQKSTPGVDERLLAALAALTESDQFTLLKKYFAALASRQERVVNTGFAPASRPDAPVDPMMPLACAEPYFFWLEVGSPVAGSIEETPTSLPVEHLPPEARLTVALFAFENEIQVTPGADVGEIQLQPGEPVRVVRQPGQLPVSPSASLSPRLFFPVRTPNRARTCRLRCHIYYQQVLVQSRLIRVRVMRHPHPVERALRSVVDYTLSRTLNPQHLARMVPHRLSLMLNDNGDGTHGFSFLGEQDFKNNASFDSDKLQDLIQQARGALRRVAWGDELPWEQGKAYRYGGPLNLAQLTKDVAHLAIRGYRFWEILINQLAGGRDEADKLAELMCKSGLVQFALKESARFVVPTALIYDYDLETNANCSDYTLCSTFQDALNNPGSLEDCSCFKGKCPIRRNNDTVICPSGFWGYRHGLGMPLSVATAPDAPLEILYQQEPQLAVGVSTDPVFTLRPAHEQALQSLQPGLGWNYGATRDDVFKLLKDTKPHLVYFFCHGGVVNNVPYIQVGAPTERGITRDNLRLKRIRWDDSHPLVFINGCRTTALEPEVALELVSAFVENARASGVVGTEITTFEPLARAFAEECLRRFLGGTTISEAVRGARLALLKAGNPLGLVYISFAMASLRLDKQPWP